MDLKRFLSGPINTFILLALTSTQYTVHFSVNKIAKYYSTFALDFVKRETLVTSLGFTIRVSYIAP